MSEGLIAIILAIISLVGASLTFVRGYRKDSTDHSIAKAEQDLKKIEISLNVYKSLVDDLDKRVTAARTEADECRKREQQLRTLITKSVSAQETLLEICQPFFDQSGNGAIEKANKLKEELYGLRRTASEYH